MPKERPHEALGMKCPARLYTASPRRYDGLPELTYPFHDRDILRHRMRTALPACKRINISSVLAGQKLGIKEVDDGIWLADFMRYDLGYFDLEQKTLQPLDNPFGTRLSPMSRYDLSPMCPGWTPDCVAGHVRNTRTENP